MALDFENIDTDLNLYSNDYRQPDGLQNVPVEIQALADSQPFLPFQKPMPAPENPEAPGFFETAKMAFQRHSEAYKIGETVYQSFAQTNPLDEYKPEGWDGVTVEAIQDYPQEYWSYILDNHGPKDLENRQQVVQDKMKAEERYQNGSWMASVIGGTAGLATSPSSYVPLAPVMKSAKVGMQTLNAIKATAPGVAASSLLHNAIEQETDIGDHLESFVLDSTRDSIFGMTLIGGGYGLGRAFTGGASFEARKFTNYIYHGGDAAVSVTQGEAGKVIPKSMEGYGWNTNVAQNAMEAGLPQEFFDSEIARTGLYQLGKITGVYKKGTRWASPLIFGLDSEYKSVNYMTNILFDHGLTTKGMQEGRAQPFAFEHEIRMERTKMKIVIKQIDDLRKLANGITPSNEISDSIKGFIQKQNTTGTYYDTEDFGKAFHQVLVTGNQSSSKEVNSAAEIVQNTQRQIYDRYLQANGYDTANFKYLPRTAYSYASRIYSPKVASYQDVKEIVLPQLQFQDQRILELERPVERARDFMNSIKKDFETSKKLSKQKRAAIKQDLEAATQEHENELKKLRQELEKEPNKILLDNWLELTHEQATELKKLLKPLTEKQNKVVEAKNELKALKSQVSKLRTKLTKIGKNAEEDAKIEKQRQSSVKAIKNAEQMIASKADEVSALEVAAMDIETKLKDKARSGEINDALYIKTKKDGISFKDPMAKPKLRRPYESDMEREMAIKQFQARVLEHTPEQNVEQIFGQMVPGTSSIPARERTFMVPDSILLNGGLLETDFTKTLSAYANFFNKRSILKEKLGQWDENGPEFIMKMLDLEHQEIKANIDKIPDEAERLKAAATAERNLKKNKKYLKNAWQVVMGNSNYSQSTLKFSKALKHAAVSTKLGGVVMTQIVDPAGQVFKHGIAPPLIDGLVPLLKSLNGMAKTQAGKEFQENAAHALVGFEHLGNAMAEKAFNPNLMENAPGSGFVYNGLEKMANVSNRVFFTSQFENFSQKWAASTIQSQITRYLEKFANGEKLRTDQMNFLLQVGIDPKKWANRFTEQFNEFGEKAFMGGRQSKYWNWSDLEASSLMSNAINKAVYDTILKPGLADAPFAFKDPVWSTFFLFKSFMFSSFTRFTAPLMQRPDANKMAGVLAMLSMGMLVDPVRQFAQGKEIETEPKKLFFNGLVNSNFLGFISDFIENADILTGGAVLPEGYREDKYRGRGVIGTAAGPIAGMADDAFSVLGMLTTGKINESETKKAGRLLPFIGTAFYTRYMLNKFIESFELPKTRSKSQGWME